MATRSHKRSDIAGRASVDYAYWPRALYYIQSLQLVGRFSETELSLELGQPNGFIAAVKNSKYVLKEDTFHRITALAESFNIPSPVHSEFPTGKIPTKRPDVKEYLLSKGIDPEKETHLIKRYWMALIEYWINHGKTFVWLNAAAGYKSSQTIQQGLKSKDAPESRHMRRLIRYTEDIIGKDGLTNIFSGLESLPVHLYEKYFTVPEQHERTEITVPDDPTPPVSVDPCLVMSPLDDLYKCKSDLMNLILEIQKICKHLPHAAVKGIQSEVLDYLEQALGGLTYDDPS